MSLKKVALNRKVKARGQKVSSRATKCTDELIEDFTFYIRRMIPISTVCELMGISKTSYQKWKNNGRKYEEALENGEKPNNNHWQYYKFFVAERKAQGHWKKNVIERSLLPKEAKPSWVRDMTILERRDPANWRRKDTLEVIENDEFNPDESFL